MSGKASTSESQGQKIGLLPDNRSVFLSSAPQSYFAVTVVLNDDDSVEDLRAEKVTGDVTFPRAPTSGDPADFCVSTEISGSPLDTQCYDISFIDEDYEPLDQVSFLSFLEFNVSATSIAVRKNGALLNSIERSATNPVVSRITVTPTATESMYTVCWTVTDGDGDGITASVYYSPDGGTAWLPVAVDQGGSCATDLDANVTIRSVRLALEPGPPFFSDGFESGNTSAWSSVVN